MFLSITENISFYVFPVIDSMFHENVLLVHLQVSTWYASLLGEPPALDPVQFGWEADHVNKCLIPQNMREGTPYALLHVLQLVRCGCESELSCRVFHGSQCY